MSGTAFQVTVIKTYKMRVVERHNDGTRHGVKHRKLCPFIQRRGLSETGSHLQSDLRPPRPDDGQV